MIKICDLYFFSFFWLSIFSFNHYNDRRETLTHVHGSNEMALKQLIGSVMSDLGFVTQDQLNTALKKQQNLSDAQMLPEKLKRTNLVAEARFLGKTDVLPFLGEVLIEMGFISENQLSVALQEQAKTLEKYCTLESNALFSVMDMGSLVNSSLNLANVLKLIMKNANGVTNSEASTLMLLEEMTQDLVFSVPTGPKADKLMDIRIKRGQGVAGWVAENETPVIIPDVAQDERFYAGIDEISGFQTLSILCVPLKARTKLIGVLEAINKADGTSFTEEDALMLTIFGSQAAMAIENARLYSELQDQYEEQKKLHKKIIESDKFLALGQMSSGVAHDFNNILGAIIGYTEMAAFDIVDGDPVKKNLDQVLTAASRARELVNQILAYARRQELERKPLDLKKLVEETLQLLRASFPATLDIRLEISQKPCSIIGDGTKIQQVIMNLCTNAYHAMADRGGVLTLALEPVELSEESAGVVGEIREGPYLKLSVSDTGTGMNEETLSRIFDPYFTTKQKGVGTGLGLSVALGIVKSHEGTIRIFSEPGKGTVFEIYLPRTDDKEVVDTDVCMEIPTGNERILLVDDEETLVKLGKQLLERLGYQVTAMTKPREALRAFQREPEAFDLVITDMTMPELTGDELSCTLLSLRPNLPVILCTGFSEKIDRETAYAKGISCFLMKPVSAQSLARAVRQTLDESRDCRNRLSVE